jgi:hypothetical protein
MNDKPESIHDAATAEELVQVAWTPGEHRSLSRDGQIRWVSGDGETYRVWLPDLRRAAITPGIPKETLERRGAVFTSERE